MKRFFCICLSAAGAVLLLCACAGSETVSAVSKEIVSSASLEQPDQAAELHETAVSSEELDQTKDLRETAYSQLPEEKRSIVSPDWHKAQIDTVVLNQSMGYDIDSGYIDRQVYVIDFPCNYSGKDLIDFPGEYGGNILVYVSIDREQIVGYGLTD